MIVYVLNLDTEPGRYDATVAHLADYDDLEIRRFPAVSTNGIDSAGWKGANIRDPERRIAIVRSYRKLLQDLAGAVKEDGWLVIQDDIRFTQHPIRAFARPLHLYTGWILRQYTRAADGYLDPIEPPKRRETDPYTTPHLCPRAFHLTREAIGPLLAAWADESRQTCESWTSYFTRATMTHDYPETAYVDEESTR